MVSSSPMRQHLEPGQKDNGDGDFKAELLALIPFLRAFARSLTGNQEGADDLAQETLVKAWQSRATFIPGTNLKAWLFTILRNQFYSDRRRAWRQAPWDQDAAERIPGGGEDQIFSAQLSDTARALRVPVRRTARSADPGGRGRLLV